MNSFRVRLLLCLAFALMSAGATGQVAGTGIVRHSPALNGTVEGSLQVLLPEGATLNGGAAVTSDLLVPGTPTVRLNGNVTFGGTLDGTGSTAPATYQITLNGGAKLGRVVRRTDAVALPQISAPPPSRGTRSITITSATQSVGDFSTVRDLTLNGGVGQFAVPPGTYGDFVANGGSGFTLGIAGATHPTVYNFQRLTLNGQTQVQVIGPVVLNVAYALTANGVIGNAANPAWLTMNIYSSGLTLNGGSTVHAFVTTPTGAIVINGNAQLVGGIACDRLQVAGTGLLRLIALTNSNRPPIANNIAVSLNEDSSAAITLVASDPDGDALIFARLSSPTHGTLTGIAPAFTYTPNANFSGNDSFTFKASDGQADSNTATVLITVAPINDRPSADPNAITVVEDTPASIILSGSDVDGDTLSFSITSQPAHGILSGSGANRVYTPAPNYNGPDSFTYVASDGSLTSSTATVTIAVSPVNDEPVALSASYSVNEGSSVAIVLGGSDADGNSLTFQVLSPPSNGTLAGTAPNLAYQPNANFNGSDSFTFRVFDGQVYSAPATITVTVTNLNFAPIASAAAAATDEDSPLTLTLRATDQDGQPLTYSIVTPPQNGALGTVSPAAGNTATVIYTPNANFNGSDTFTFKARDTAFADSNVAAVTITVRPINDAPIASAQTAQTDEDTAVTIVLTGSDVENTVLTFAIVGHPANGTLGPIATGPNNTASVVYTPAANFNGADAFTFKVNDGDRDSAAATVALTIRPINDPPVALSQTLSTNEDAPLTITLRGSDVENAALTFAIVTPPTLGSLGPITSTGPATATVLYTPNPNASGADSFTFKASDAERESSPATVSLTITAQNDAPVATDQTLAQPQDTTFSFTLAATDPDGDILTYTVVTPPPRGSLSGSAPNLTYTPQLNDRSTVSLTFTATDGTLTSNLATVSFTMTPVNQPPVAASLPPIAIDEDTGTTITLTATDIDGDALTFQIVAQPAHGSLSAITPAGGNTATVIYSPSPNFNGADSFSFKANDNPRDSNVVTVSITVRPINDPPIASAQSILATEDTVAAFALTATDVDGDPLTYSIVTQPTNGTVAVNGSTVTYTPNVNFAGGDSFSWRAADASLATSNTATVSILVAAVNDPPVAASKSITTDEDVPVTVTLTATDVDSTNLSFVIVTPPARGTLTGTLPALTYRPAANDSGTYAFTYKANDGFADSAIATVSLTVRAVNDPPIANPLTISTSTATPTAITLTGSDIDSPALTFAIASPPQNGAISGSPPNITYTSSPNFGGFDSFTFTANDGSLTSAPATIQITTGLPPRSKTFTTTADFAGGTLESISTAIADQLSNKTVLSAYDVVWVPVSSKGTVVKLDAETGRVLGEYLTAPADVSSPYPSRVAIDSKGNAWIANMSHSSIVKIGMVENGGWSDRNSSGIVETSANFGDVRPWAAGNSVVTASDEAILLYVRTGVSGVRHLSVDSDDNVWVGAPGGPWQKFDGRTGALLATQPSVGRGENGGFVTLDGRMYSAGDQFLIWDVNSPIVSLAQDDNIRALTWAAALDSAGNLWTTRDSTTTVAKYSPTGVFLGEYYHGEPWAMGIAIDANDHVWIAHSHCGHSVGHLLPDGRFVGNVEVANHGPVEVSVDRRGRIWVVSSTGVVERINPLGGPLGADGVTPIGEIDVRSGNLGGALWSYGRFTGSAVGLASPDGYWTNVYDGTLAASTWGPVVWNGLLCNDARLEVQAALGSTPTTFGPYQTLTLANPTPSGVGRYLKTRVRLVSATTGEPPALYDLTVGTTGYTPPATPPSWSVSAGEDIAGNWPDVIQLRGSFCHSAHSFPTEPAYTWSAVSGPGSVTFSNPTAKRPTAQFAAQGTYVLRVTATLNGQVSTDDVKVTLAPFNRAPYANAGYTTFIASFPPQIWLWGSVRDDGLPVGATVTSTWEKVFGPGSVTFTNPAVAATTASFSTPGVYTLRLRASDGALSNENTTDVWIGVPAPPTPPAGMVSWWQASANGDDHVGGNQAFSENGADFADGKIGGAFRFDGINDRVRIFGAPSLNVGPRDGISVEMWVRPAAERTATMLQYGQGTSRGFQIRQVGRRVEVDFREVNGTSHVMGVDEATPASVWTHVTASYNRVTGEARIFINGTLRAAQNFGSMVLATNYDVFLGERADGTEPFVGLLDEISLYDRAMFADEISTIVSAGKRPPVSNIPPVVNAGIDLWGKAVNVAVPLAGSVSDDGQPTNGALSTLWSKVVGPGTVTFSNSSQPQTSATFSAPGLYVLKLLADDGAFIAEDTVEVRVASLGTFETDSSIAAWWPANGGDVDVVRGLKAERFHGTTFDTGQVEQAFLFDGSDDQIRIRRDPALDLATSASGFTIEFWLRADRRDGLGMIVWTNGAAEGASVTMDGRFVGMAASLNLRDTTGQDHFIDGPSIASDLGQWVHLAYTFEAVSRVVRCFKNGAIATEQTLSSGWTPQTSYDVWIGSYNGTFKGALDELAMYRRPLKFAEIDAIYRAGATGKNLRDGNQPPIVIAGADLQITQAGGTALLNGSVVDDGQPVSGNAGVTWSKVDGPGSVAFGSASGANTTATFGAPGIYVLRLDADDGAKRAPGDTVVVRAGVVGTFEADSSLAAWWPGNGDTREMVHGGHDVELLNGATFTAAKVSQGFVFDGVNDYAKVPRHADLDIGTSSLGFTIELWLRSDQRSGLRLFGWQNGATPGVSIEFDGRFGDWSPYLNVRDTTGAEHLLAGVSIVGDLGQWVHVAYTYDRVTGLGRTYRNGVLAAEVNVGTGWTPQTSWDLVFGGAPVKGALDEISLYRRPLAYAEIAAIYQAGAIGKNPLDGNQLPTVNAGPDLNVAATTGIILSGTVADDGMPIGGGTTATWTKVEGPGTATFANVNSPATTVTFGVAGTYVLKLDAHDGQKQAPPDFVVVRAGVTGTAEPDASIAAWWPANGDNREAVRGGHDAELFNGATFGTGRTGQAFTFDGINDYAIAARHLDLNVGTSPAGFTIEFWTRMEALAQDTALVGWGGPDGRGTEALIGSRFAVAYADWHLRDTAGQLHSVDGPQLSGLENQWIHLAYTYDRSSGFARIYLNGNLGAQAYVGNTWTPSTTQDVWFAARAAGGPRFKGALDEITFYRRALTYADITAIYGAGVNGKSPLDDNLPPNVSAGPDLIAASIADSVSLVGLVVDDNRPFGVPQIQWSKADGPGAVTFATPNAATTTATFSAPGTYVLRLEATDRFTAVQSDLVIVRIGTATIEPDSALVAWWPVNGDPQEIVRGGHDLEMMNGATYVAGKIGQAIRLNGTTSFVRTASYSDLDIGTSSAGFTFDFWLKGEDFPLDSWLLSWGNETTVGVEVPLAHRFGARWADFVVRDTAGGIHELPGPAMSGTEGQWQHLAFSYDRSSGVARIYLNGTIASEGNLGNGWTPRTNLDLWIGSRFGNSRFRGAIDELSFYRRVLSFAEINRIFTAGVNGKSPLDDNQPPVVSAGPNITLASSSASAALNGFVLDDDRPFGAPRLQWSKADGPGDVTFANPTAAITTASFSGPGTYLVQLTASDGYSAPVWDIAEVRVGLSPLLPSGITAWWPLNGDPRDVVDRGPDLRLENAAVYAPGKVLQGVRFDGATGYASAAAHPHLDIGTSATGFTTEFWFKSELLAGSQPLLLWHNGSAAGVQLMVAVGFSTTYVNINVRDTAGVDHTIIGPSIAAELGQWIHFALVYDRTTGSARVYKNGVAQLDTNLGTGWTPQTSYDLWIGSAPGNRTFKGTFDELALYSRPLAPGEISAIFAAAASGKTPNATNVLPTVLLAAPTPSSAHIVNTPVMLTALASDVDGTIARVEFFDGATKLGETTVPQSGQPSAFTFTSSGFALGRHALTAVASDNAGANVRSSEVIIDVVPVLPLVAITSPANNATFGAGAPLALQATASYSAGSIARVEFYDRGIKLGETSTPLANTYSLSLINGLTAGTHMLTAKAIGSDGANATSATILIATTTSAPTIALTSPANNSALAANTAFTLTATASDADGSIAKVEFFRGTTKLGEDLTSPYTFDVSGGLPVGTYSFTARAIDGTGLATTSVPVTITVSGYSGAPVALLSSPSEDARIAQPMSVMGVVAHGNLLTWTLEYRLKAAQGAPAEPWATVASGNTLVGTPATSGGAANPALLGTFDPTSLINGIYELQLRVVGTDGLTTFDRAEPTTVIVEGNMKVGAFTLAFEDLKLPLVGIPITVTRTYDSRDLRIGDFGPGWRLALNNIRVQRNRAVGTAWYQTEPPLNPPPLFPFYVTPQRERIVTVVMPDGETHRFRAGVDVRNLFRTGDPDNVSFSVPATRGKLKFYAIGDTTSKLEPLDGNSQLNDTVYLHGTGEQDLMTGDAADPDAVVYTATRFRLTTSDGTLYILDETLGLLELRDLNGNTLALNRDAAKRVTGITSTQNLSSGLIARTIAIVRDGTGRVDFIRDPAGKDLDYLYDAQGRLSSFTNRELNVTQFRYELAAQPNYLTRVIDPRGASALRSEYDSGGKLVKQIDADGKETIFARGIDTTGRFEKVRDRLGNESTFYYDERGNVTLKIDPLGAQTSYAYYADSDRVKFETDHYGNVKSMAYDALGNATTHTIGARVADDPSNPTTGHTTRTLFNSLSAPTQITDPDGRVQTFAYDPASNNLLSHTVGASGGNPSTTTFTYNADGSLNVVTDPLGNTTRHDYTYSFADPVYPTAVKQVTVSNIDPGGSSGSDPANLSATVLRVTRTLFDVQENQVAQIVSRTLPDGTNEDVVTRYFYDAENRVKATILPDGRVTETRYTAFGKPDKVLLWKSSADYEAHNDTNARVTSYGYDARGNETSIVYADATTELTQFDAENRRTWSQDRRGYRTFFVYDAVGRLRFTIHPDANDGVGSGAPTNPSDARLADNPRTETVYDLVGRATDTYDELRHRTQFVYFADGTPDAMRRRQTVGVRSGANVITTFAYDSTGNIRFVTDPRGNTTETRYDEQGRPRLVIFPATDEHPATQLQTKYDAASRRVEVVDQEGKITRYRYDALGRLAEVRQYIDEALAAADGSFALSSSTAGVAVTRYTYDALGHQQTQIDALGRITTYWTDRVGRRIKRILPKDTTEATALAETLQYDGWGNLWKRTDFAGRTTTFAFDAVNRLKSKVADATHPSLGYSHATARVEFDYDANGRRSAARSFSASNTLLYSETTPHDERGRLDYKDTAGGRLDYSYYANSRLKDVVSSNANGINVGYRYDELNRLESVDDAATGATRTTGYSYNANGSLETVTQPNAVVHSYSYDALNRLRGLIVARGSNLIHTYEYKLRPSGHRRQVVEGAKATAYSYDGVFRLTAESVTNDPRGNNGEINYDLDKVGNRLARTSQVAAVASQTNQSFNARDWLNGDTFTANGSTISSTGFAAANPSVAGTDVYDFEERLIVRARADGSTVNVTYDPDGHRIAKNVLNAAGLPISSATWHVDTNNLTGYAQVVEERVNVNAPSPASIVRSYTYGSDLIAQTTSTNSGPWSTSYFAYDGHGSTRELTDAGGAVTDRYDYDAFGLILFRSGTTPNAYLYCGEQFDPDLGLYYLRARYLNPDAGRFWTMDEWEGNAPDSPSSNKFNYADANPVAGIDPGGRFTLKEVVVAVAITSGLALIARPAVRPLVAGIVGFAGGPDTARYSISSIGVYDESAELLQAFGLSPDDFSGNLVADAFIEVGTDTVSGAIGAAGTSGVFRGFAAFRRATLDWRVAAHAEMPSPRPGGYESHHGVNSVWMKANAPGYRADRAPAVLMRNDPFHNATRGIFNRLRIEIAARQGVSPRNIDWSKVQNGTAWRIAEEQFEAAKVPASVREQYFRRFNEYLEELRQR